MYLYSACEFAVNGKNTRYFVSTRNMYMGTLSSTESDGSAVEKDSENAAMKTHTTRYNGYVQ